MKKILLSALLSVGFVFIVPAAAFANATNMVVGHIYNQQHKGVSGASVVVICDTPGGGTTEKDTTSVGDGSYTVSLDTDHCPTGASVHVTAHTANTAGSNTVPSGNEFSSTAINITLSDVSVGLPEMGTVVGGIAALGAGGAFMVIRRKQQVEVS